MCCELWVAGPCTAFANSHLFALGLLRWDPGVCVEAANWVRIDGDPAAPVPDWLPLCGLEYCFPSATQSILIQIKAEPLARHLVCGHDRTTRRILDSAYARDRAFMVERHLKVRGIGDPLLLAAMGTVPRETFVPEHLQEFAYEDSALPIEAGQTISQPYIVARMLELAEIKPGDKVLEVGAGSGYAAAVMSRMANEVFAIERHEELAKLARARLKRLGYANAEIVIADGTKGLPEEAPFQAIIVSAGGPQVPEALKQQLAIGGRLIIPIGPFGFQTLMRVRRTGKDSFEEEDYGAVAFVPLIGEQGWAEPERVKEAQVDAEPSGFAAGLLLPAKRALTIHNRVSRLMAEAAEPFGDLHELCDLVERFGDRRVILLGEATHGTAEFSRPERASRRCWSTVTASTSWRLRPTGRMRRSSRLHP